MLAAAAEQFPSDQIVVVAMVNEMPLVFNTLHLVYHHAAQGVIDDQAWMVSFCMICNAGACFSPVVDGKVHHFTERGLYNAMTILADSETNSIWNHITGECMYGVLCGHQLKRLSSLQQTTLKQAAAAFPDGRFVLATLSTEQQADATEWEKFRISDTPSFSERLVKTMDKEDTRLPRLEAGLGVWSENGARFYPYTSINALNNFILDTFDGRTLLVFIDPESSHPNALYVNAAQAWLNDDELRSSNGGTVSRLSFRMGRFIIMKNNYMLNKRCVILL
jgi:hypothetical protein